jgi:hypothetical protein
VGGNHFDTAPFRSRAAHGCRMSRIQLFTSTIPCKRDTLPALREIELPDLHIASVSGCPGLVLVSARASLFFASQRHTCQNKKEQDVFATTNHCQCVGRRYRTSAAAHAPLTLLLTSSLQAKTTPLFKSFRRHVRNATSSSPRVQTSLSPSAQRQRKRSFVIPRFFQPLLRSVPDILNGYSTRASFEQHQSQGRESSEETHLVWA